MKLALCVLFILRELVLISELSTYTQEAYDYFVSGIVVK